MDGGHKYGIIDNDLIDGCSGNPAENNRGKKSKPIKNYFYFIAFLHKIKHNKWDNDAGNDK